tara:strand:+ start:247843 stop:248115 length:273 start_codon:yes stop_codon:yes gene_type:complete
MGEHAAAWTPAFAGVTGGDGILVLVIPAEGGSIVPRAAVSREDVSDKRGLSFFAPFVGQFFIAAPYFYSNIKNIIDICEILTNSINIFIF